MDSVLDENTQKFVASTNAGVPQREHSTLGHFGLAITIFTLLAIGVFFTIHRLRAKLRARRYHASLPNVNPRVAYKAPQMNRNR